MEAANLEGIEAEGADFTEATLASVEGQEADFTGARFDSANVSGADLREAELARSSAIEADFEEANLEAADLSQVDLTGAKLVGTDLRGADLSGANLEGADLSGALLGDADLSQARLAGATLVGAVDLTDQQLEQALGVSSQELGNALQQYGIKLNEPGEIYDALRAACSGSAAPGTALYLGGAGAHPTVALKDDGTMHDWTGRLTVPVALRAVELVACLAAPATTTIERCGPYFGAGDPNASYVHRQQHQVKVRLIAAATGVVAWEETINGSVPRACLATESFPCILNDCEDRFEAGSEVTFETFELWLSKFVLGTSTSAPEAPPESPVQVENIGSSGGAETPAPPGDPAEPPANEDSTASEDVEYEIAYEDGYERGYGDGLGDGENEGYDDGWRTDPYEPDESSACSGRGGDGRYGRSDLFLTASEEGFDEGYDQGYCDGYLEGYAATYDEGFQDSPCGPSSLTGC